MSHIRYGLHSPSIWRVRRLRTHHNWASHSFTLLLVGCHINCDGTTNATMYSFFVFTHCHLSLSSITTITYSLSINPSHAMSVLWHPQRILRNFYLYFSSTRFYIASNDASMPFFLANLGSRARTLRTAVACLCVQSRVLATAARLSNFPSHARVIQFIYCLSTRQRNWIRVNRLNSYCFIIFIQKLSIMLPTESLVVQSFVRSFAAHNQLLDTRSFKASAS